MSAYRAPASKQAETRCGPYQERVLYCSFLSCFSGLLWWCQCLAGDGQVSQGNLVVKPNAKKIRRLPQGVILGFAGATADCFALLEKLESKLEEHPGQLIRSCVELAKQWRTDRYLRHLEAVLIVADQQLSLEVSGVGDVLESHDGILAVGSGGPYAAAAARALYDVPGMGARQICEKAMKIAADMCCHTNHEIIFETMPNTATSEATKDAVSSLISTNSGNEGSSKP